MKRIASFLLLLAIAISSYAQGNDLDTFFARSTQYPLEKVHLHCDKYVLRQGDTLWWKGYVSEDGKPSTLSTNLYVEFFCQDGRLLWHGLSPIMKGLSLGQVPLPDSLRAGTYWLKAYTRYELNFDSSNLFAVPVTVLDPRMRDKNVVKVRAVEPSGPWVSDLNGFLLISSLSDSGLVCHIEADNPGVRPDRPMDLLLVAHRSPLLRARFTIPRGRDWQDIPLRTLGFRGKGEVLLFSGNSLVNRESVDLGPLESAPVEWSADTCSPEGITVWHVRVKGPTLFNCSVSVSDARETVEEPVRIVDDRSDDPWDHWHTGSQDYPQIRYEDTSFLTWKGTVKTQAGTPLSGGELIVMLDQQADRDVRPVIVAIDEQGRIKISGAFFFDSASLSCQLNGFQDDPRTKKIRMVFDAFSSPGFIPPSASRWRDSLCGEEVFGNGKVDTLLPPETKVKELPEVVVKAEALKELDQRYAKGIFTEPAPYNFDLREDKTVTNIWMYLRKNLPGFQGGPDIAQPPGMDDDRKTIFYVDGEPKSVDEVEDTWYEEIAYVKAYTSLMVDESVYMKSVTGDDGFQMVGAGPLKIPMNKEDPSAICIYTRKEKDIRSAWKGLPRMRLEGYTRVLPWSPNKADVTLYWNPVQEGNDFTIRFYNHHAERFRLCIEGMDATGKVVHYETVISTPPQISKISNH